MDKYLIGAGKDRGFCIMFLGRDHWLLNIGHSNFRPLSRHIILLGIGPIVVSYDWGVCDG